MEVKGDDVLQRFQAWEVWPWNGGRVAIWSLLAKSFGLPWMVVSWHILPTQISAPSNYKLKTSNLEKSTKMSRKIEDNKKKQDWLEIEDSEEEGTGNDSEQEEEESRVKELERRSSKRRKVDHASSASEDDDDDIGGGGSGANGEEDGKEIDQEQGDILEKAKKKSKSIDKRGDLLITSSSKLKPLSKEELAASKEATAKTGVVYLSRVPVCSTSPRLI